MAALEGIPCDVIGLLTQFALYGGLAGNSPSKLHSFQHQHCFKSPTQEQNSNKKLLQMMFLMLIWQDGLDIPRFLQICKQSKFKFWQLHPASTGEKGFNMIENFTQTIMKDSLDTYLTVDTMICCWVLSIKEWRGIVCLNFILPVPSMLDSAYEYTASPSF